MGQSKFVEVVDVGDPKIKRSEEDDLLFREVGDHMEWYYERPPD
jgi:hypothetical protein